MLKIYNLDERALPTFALEIPEIPSLPRLPFRNAQWSGFTWKKGSDEIANNACKRYHVEICGTIC
jgi:hypothetical protein